MRACKQRNAGKNSRATFECNANGMQTFIPTHHTLWKYNRRIMKPLLPMSTTSKQQLSDVPLTMTLWPSVCLLRDFWMHTTTAKIYKKGPQTLSEVIRIVEKFNAAQQLAATLTPLTVSMMSNDDRGFVCRQTGHFGHHCPYAQCYNCDEFGHFAQDCPNKVPSSGTPHHQDISFQAMIHPDPKGQIRIYSL